MGDSTHAVPHASTFPDSLAAVVVFWSAGVRGVRRTQRHALMDCSPAPDQIGVDLAIAGERECVAH